MNKNKKNKYKTHDIKTATSRDSNLISSKSQLQIQWTFCAWNSVTTMHLNRNTSSQSWCIKPNTWTCFDIIYFVILKSLKWILFLKNQQQLQLHYNFQNEKQKKKNLKNNFKKNESITTKQKDERGTNKKIVIIKARVTHQSALVNVCFNGFQIEFIKLKD